MKSKTLGEFELDKVHLINNLEGLDKLPDKSVHFVFTDGPGHATTSLRWLSKLYRVLHDNGVIYQPTPTPQRIDNYLDNEYTNYSAQSWMDVYSFFGFYQLDRIVARDPNTKNKQSHFLWTVFMKQGSFTFLRDDRCIFLNFPKSRLSKDISEMGRSPEEYRAMIRQGMCNPDIDYVVLDIHAGSGACGVAALELGVKYIGFEDDSFGVGICEQANERLDKVKEKLKKRKK